MNVGSPINRKVIATEILFAGALLGAAAPVPVALAEEAAGARIEEIVVTAQRREENLQEVPIAVSSFSASELTASRISTIENVALKTPNFTLVPQASGNTTYGVAMRGVALTDSVITADSPVGIYVDGVVVSKMAGGIFDFVDLERVEVLRGPQGTLYGRNTPAGAINLVSRKPSGEWGFDATAGLGNYSQKEVRVGVDTATADLGGLGKLSARISGRYLDRDGWAKNTSTGDDLDSRHRVGGRLSLRWQPSDSVTVDYAFDKLDIKEQPPAAQLTADFTGFLAGFVNTSRQDEFALSYNLPPPAPGFFSIDRTDTQLDIEGHTLTAEWEVSPALTVKSITGYREFDDEEPTDFDGTPIAWADFNVYQSLETFSEELQLIGSALDDRIRYVTGLYYYDEKADVRAPGVFGFGTVKQEPQFKTNNSSWAAYAQIDWNPEVLDRKLTLTGGLRYTQDEREMTDHHVFVNDAIDLTDVDKVSKDFDKVTPSFTAAYQVTTDANVYFRYAEGYRSGGFNGRSSTPDQVATAFEPETLNAYEVGLKSLLWDRRLQLNVAAFLSDYEDLQQVLTAPTSTGVGFQTTNDNVGKITITGVEVETRLAATDNLEFYLNYSYLDTDIDDYTLCMPEGAPDCQPTSVDNERVIPLISKNTLSAGVDYLILSTDNGGLRAHVDAYYRGEAIGGGATLKVHPMEDDPSYIRDYTLVNARLAWEEVPIGPGRFEIALWGENLTDRDSAQFALNLASSLGIGVTRFLTPRTYGVDLSYRF
jgi:iron complex outermembrane receptor protein